MPEQLQPSDDEPTAWDDFRKCPVCSAQTGRACRALTGRVEGAKPSFVATVLPRPHSTRQLGARAAREGGAR